MNNRKEKQRVMERSQYDKFNMKKTLPNDADHKMLIPVASGFPSVAFPWT